MNLREAIKNYAKAASDRGYYDERGAKVAKWHPRIVALWWVPQTESWAEHEYKAFSEVI